MRQVILVLVVLFLGGIILSFPNYAALVFAIASALAFILLWKFRKTRSQKFLYWLLIPVSLTLLILGFAPALSEQGDAGVSLFLIAIIAVLIIPILIYFGLAGLIGDLAKTKGRSWAAFYWLSILLSPLIMWIIAASVSPAPGSSAYVAPNNSLKTTESTDIAKEIEKLGSLKEQGLITKAEFEAKKKELLDRM